jgi:hypothetical protein
LTETFKIREDKKINPYEYSKGLVWVNALKTFHSQSISK